MKLKWEKEGLKSPLARARGLGSAHEGAGHWMQERITSVALIPLCLWLVYQMVQLRGADYTVFTSWLAEPLNAVLMLLTIVIGFYHAAMGGQVIVEDYVDHEGWKIFSVIFIKLAFFVMGVACIFAILKVAL